MVYPNTFELISQSIQLFRLKFNLLVKVVLLPSLVNSLLVFGFSSIFNPKMDTLPNFLSSVPLYGLVLFFLLFIFTALWAQAGLIYAIIHLKKDFTLTQIYRQSFHFILSQLLLTLLSGLIVFGASLLLIIPGIILGVVFSLSFLVLYSENETPIRSLLKSRYYLTGHLKAYLQRCFFFTIILTSLYIASTVVISLVNINLLSSLFDLISNIFISIITLIFSYLNFLYLRSLKPKSAVFIPTRRSQTLIYTLATFAIIIIVLLGFFLVSNRSFFA